MPYLPQWAACGVSQASCLRRRVVALAAQVYKCKLYFRAAGLLVRSMQGQWCQYSHAKLPASSAWSQATRRPLRSCCLLMCLLHCLNMPFTQEVLQASGVHTAQQVSVLALFHCCRSCMLLCPCRPRTAAIVSDRRGRCTSTAWSARRPLRKTFSPRVTRSASWTTWPSSRVASTLSFYNSSTLRICWACVVRALALSACGCCSTGATG